MSARVRQGRPEGMHGDACLRFEAGGPCHEVERIRFRCRRGPVRVHLEAPQGQSNIPQRHVFSGRDDLQER
ncbi:MAG: hypothetical protein MK142_16440 [Pseudomonadales bacterium]|nr:hypothetical protein [Pseudomonadales bacterium]